MRLRTTAFVIFLLSFLAFAALSPQDTINTQIVTRLGLTLSMLEDGTLTIDRFAERTIDKALHEGHYYADKVPGHPFLAIPSVVVARALLPAVGLGGDTLDPDVFHRYAYVATLGTNALFSAVAAALFFLSALRLGGSSAGALFATAGLVLATPFLGWSTAFFAHSVSASLLVFLGALLIHSFWARPDRPPMAGRPVLSGALTGLSAGLAIFVDLTTAPVTVVLCLTALVLAWRQGRDFAQRYLPAAILGGLVALIPLLVYNQIAFSSPFKLGYSSVVGFEGMQSGFFGITWPSPGVLMQILFGLYRGLLPLAPILLLVPAGLLRLAGMPGGRLPAALVAAATVIYLWINSSYFYWDGGYSTGPRHLVPLLPFLCLTLAFAWPRGVLARRLALALLAVSGAISLICAAVDMFAPEFFPYPFVQHLWPNFWAPEPLLRSLPVLAVWLGFAWLARRLAADPQQARQVGSLRPA